MEQTQRNLTTAAIFWLVSASFFLFDRLGIITPLRNFVAVPFEFIQLPVVSVKTNLISKIEFITQLAKIEEENAKLATKLAEMTAENIRLQNLAAENEALRAQMEFAGRQIKSIPAKVIGFSRFLVVSPEADEEVKLGATVTLGNNFVGQVVGNNSKLIKVRLPGDPASSIPAAVVTSQGFVRGNLVGKYGKGQFLEKIEKQEVVPEGSIVQTTGEGEVLPGLVLGKVKRVERPDPLPFLDIEVESFVNFSRLSTVFILKNE